MAIALYESFRAVFYTPFYLAHALHAYEAEGVEVNLTNSPDLDYRASGLVCTIEARLPGATGAEEKQAERA